MCQLKQDAISEGYFEKDEQDDLREQEDEGQTAKEYNQERYNKSTLKYGGNYSNRCGFKCISCGVECSPAEMEFCDDDPQLVKCYKCQYK